MLHVWYISFSLSQVLRGTETVIETEKTAGGESHRNRLKEETETINRKPEGIERDKGRRGKREGKKGRKTRGQEGRRERERGEEGAEKERGREREGKKEG